MKGHAAVAAIFRRVRDHAGMAEWPCTVEPVSETPRIETSDSGRIPVFTYQREHAGSHGTGRHICARPGALPHR